MYTLNRPAGFRWPKSLRAGPSGLQSDTLVQIHPPTPKYYLCYSDVTAREIHPPLEMTILQVSPHNLLTQIIHLYKLVLAHL